MPQLRINKFNADRKSIGDPMSGSEINRQVRQADDVNGRPSRSFSVLAPAAPTADSTIVTADSTAFIAPLAPTADASAISADSTILTGDLA